jgi:hypothetical protein
MAKTVQLTPDEVLGKLRVERHRLEGALARFYSHDLSDDTHVVEGEALDICVPIRVMVHDTWKSTSLLSQLDPDYWNKPIHFQPLLAPPPRTLSSGQQVMTVTIPVNLQLSGGPEKRKTRFIRYESNHTSEFKVPLRDWWLNPCWSSGSIDVSNKDLVLALANKEGGAHVDGDHTPSYEAAKNQGIIMLAGKPISSVVRMGNFVGTAGDELLEYLRDNYQI